MIDTVVEPITLPQEEVFPEAYTNLAFDNEIPKEEPLPVETAPKPKKQGRKKKPEEQKEIAKTIGFFQLFRYATPLDIFAMIVGVICCAVHGVSLPLMIVVFGQMTDSFVRNGQQGNLTAVNISVNVNSSAECRQLPGVDIEAEMQIFAYYFVGIAAVVIVFATLQVMLFVFTASTQTKRIRSKYFHAILHQPMEWFDTHKIGVLNVRLTDDLNTISDGLGDKISIIVQLFCTTFSGIIIGFIYGWKLTLVILSVCPLLTGSGVLWSKALIILSNKERSAYAEAGSVAEEILVAIRTVMAFNGQNKATEKYETILEDAKHFGVKRALISNLSLGAMQCIIYFTYALGFWYGTKLSVDEPENYSIGSVVIVFFSVLIGLSSLGGGAKQFEAIVNARGAAYEIYKTIDLPRPIDSSSKEGHKPDSVKGDIEFKNIQFSYPSRKDITILKGMSLNVPRGKTIALVGASGCGKSTTIQLLLRFYEPNTGEILLDGHDIRSLNVKWLRENMAIVSQEPVLFATTIAQNIRYGREDATDEDIERAVREANAYDFISKLPDKLNTMVGERGAQLSGGQKQRIAIARALVKNPKILLLDEATSALDTQSEAIVQAALDKARAGRTTIIIAHRLSTIRTADIIAGFDGGVVKELGTHSELMNLKGIYYSLVMQQTSNNNDSEKESSDLGTSSDESSDESSDVANEEDQDQTLEENREIKSIFPRNSLRRKSSKKKGKRRKKFGKKGKKNEEKEEEPLPDISFSRILALNKSECPLLVIGTLACVVDGAIFPCVGILFSKIIGVFAEIDPDVRREKTMLFSLLFLLLGGVSFLANLIQGCTFGKSGEILTLRLRSQSFYTIMKQEVGWFDDDRNAVGVLTTKLATDASQAKGATGAKLAMLTLMVSSLTTAVIVGFVHSWQLSLLLLVCVPLLLGSNIIAMKASAGHASKDQKALELSGKISTEAVENFQTVAALTLEDVFYRKFTSSLRSQFRTGIRKAPLDGMFYAFAEAIPYLIRAAMFRFGSWLIAHCYTNFENVFLVFAVVAFSALSLGRISSTAPDFGNAKASAQRIIALLQQKPEVDIHSEDGEKLTDCVGDIEFRDVHFAYPMRPDMNVLQGLNVSVKPGQTLALVGGSGCGKSTSIQLLERFYDPSAGHVYMDGQDTKELNLAWLRSQLGLVSQEPILFDCTVAENIQYGDNSRIISQDEVEDAAKNANIHEFILSLPEKYDTRVGDKGTQLSGGQKQRVAIARALIRRPKVLLLDEATSALDTESEKVVQKALDNARLGRTCIVIAHRLSTIQNADIIAVIQNGMVIEQGTHGELMAKREAYYALVNSQGSH
ncbi:hypothetical protein SKAU_G00219860 [Synaphobranchus kaupii]|uniref:Uncharacterized protein n=1 Tax=Synaphobranchus kaupii TaxID=118154 RepID=A0A9Q1FAJ0_SYNKA|nr:hypothetical protein SKAU_G00219860 [Synaphobranchus kaupii]